MAGTPIRLRYMGDGPEVQHWIAGWPAEDHDEDDPKRAALKIASGLYKAVVLPDTDLSKAAQKRLEKAAAAGEEHNAAREGDADYQQPPEEGTESSEEG